MQDHPIRQGFDTTPQPPSDVSRSSRRRSRLPAHSERHTVLGHVVRYMRARHGLSQEELGHRAGLHRNYVGAIERGEINPTFRVLLKVALGLGIPLSELIATAEQEMPTSDASARLHA
jgi:ribosome-binding protein aMBF1 (putative translation factor)